MKPRHLLVGMLFLGLVAAIGALTGLASPARAQGGIPTPSPQQWVIYLTNQERAQAGLPPLRENARLAQAALSHALAMAEGDFFAHENLLAGTGPAERVRAAGYDWVAVAENIFAGSAEPTAAVQQWLASPEHRENILNPQVREIGVGYALDPGDIFPKPETPYRHYWVQVFGADPQSYPLIINHEAFSTTTRTVSLYIYGEGWAQEMRLRNDEDAFGPWEPYQPHKTWTLREQAGLRTVAVELRSGNEIRSASDSIYYIPAGSSAVSAVAVQLQPTPTLAPGVPPRLPDSVVITRQIDPPTLTAGQEARVTLRLSGADLSECRGIPGKPVDVIMVFDISSSAGIGPGSNWESTVAFTRQLLDSLSQPVAQDLQTLQPSRVGLITSRTVATGTIPLLQQPLTTDYEIVRAALGNIAIGGDTDIAAGVQLAADTLAKVSAAGRSQAVLLMLHDNVPLTKAALETIGKVRDQGIAVYLVVNPHNIPEENQITAAMAAQAVPAENFFNDPKPDDLRRLFILATAGDLQAAVRNFRLVDEWNPAGGIELFDVSGPGGRVEKNRVLWDIPRLGRGETIEIGYQVRVPKGFAEQELRLGSGSAGIDCNGYLFNNLIGADVAVVAGPTATPLILPVSTPVPAATPTPTPTPTPIGALITPALPPTPTPGALAGVPRPSQPVFCTARYWWVPAFLLPLLLLLLVVLLLWLWSRRQHIAWYNLWSKEWRWPCRILSVLSLLYLLWLAFLAGRELFVGLCKPSEAVYFWRMDRSRGDFGIFLTTLGSETEPLPFAALNREGCVGCHAVASSGGRIAAVEGPVPGRGLVRTLAGEEVRIPNIPAMYFAWSPDGSKLAYAAADENIYILDIQTGANAPLQGASAPDVAETMPTWSPDGSVIAFVRSESSLEWGLNVTGPSDIYVVPATGGEARPVQGASGDGFNYYPSFSPDGKWLAFTRHTTGHTSYADEAAEIFIVPATGGEARRLQANDAEDGSPLRNVSNSWPTWSRDGRLLAFNSKRNDPAFDIFVTEIDANGNSGPARPLAGASQPGVFEHTPFWGEPIQPLPLGKRLLNLWPWLIPLLPLLLLRWLLCRRKMPPPPPLPPLGGRPKPREPLAFLSRWRPLPPEWDPAPTLVIGLGGTGRWVLTHLKKNLLDAGADVWRGRVRLLLIDTAAREFVQGREVPVRVGDVELDEDEKLILGEDLRQVVRRLAQDPTAEPEMRSWFPAEDYVRVRKLPDAQLDVRQSTSLRRPLGRAVVFRDLHQGEASRLWQALSRAVREAIEGEHVRVLIIGSLCGGFGSGALADVAYVVRRAAETLGGEQAASAVITAFLATDNAFVPYTRAPQLKLNAMATLRELGRFQLAAGRPFPMTYNRYLRDELFNGYVQSALFDEVFLFDGQRSQYPLSLWQPEEAMFPLMADLATVFLDRGSRLIEQVRSNLRTQAAQVQVAQGEPVVATLGAYTYRLPLRDLVRGLKLRFAHDLITLYLAGPDFRGEKIELSPDRCRDKYPDGIPTLVDHFLRGTMTEEKQGVGDATAYIADLAQGGGVTAAWRSLASAAATGAEARFITEHMDHFRAVLVATVLRLLNGRPEDDVVVARAGKLGYAMAFLDELLQALRRAEERARYLEGQVPADLSAEHKLLLTLIEQELQAATAVREEVRKRVVFLLGEEPNGRPGERPALRGILDILQERLEQERRWREEMRRIPVRLTFAEEAFYDRLYEEYFAPYLTREGLERLFWRSEPDGTLGLAVRHWEDVTFTGDAAGQEQFIAAVLELAEAVGQEVWRLRLDPLFDDVEKGLWNEQQIAEQARTAYIWAEPVARVRAVRAREQQPHRYLWANRAIGRRDEFARQVQLAANMREAVQILNATDPYSAAVITSLDILPFSALECLERLETEYRNAHQLRIELSFDEVVEVPPERRPEPVHVFAAERHALLYEPRLPELREAPRLFHPLFVAALEDLGRARAFVLAYALGWVRQQRYQERGQWRLRYELQLPDEAQGIPLTRPDDAGDPVALVVRAMQGVVLGHPEGDRVQERYTDEEVAARLIKAVNEQVAGQVERLRAFLQRKPDDLAAEKRIGADDFWSFAQLVVEDELRGILEGGRQ